MSATARRITIAALTVLLAAGLTACQTTTQDCGVPREAGNPAQQYHAACD